MRQRLMKSPNIFNSYYLHQHWKSENQTKQITHQISELNMLKKMRQIKNVTKTTICCVAIKCRKKVILQKNK
jgi:hypothetical protein